VHDVARGRRAQRAALLDLNGVLLLPGQKGVGQIDDVEVFHGCVE
jgi:hypothetical protein